MNEISGKRILRWSIASVLVMLLWSFVAGSGIAAATTIYNNGTETLSSNVVKTYQPTGSTSSIGTPWTRIIFDITNYNSMASIVYIGAQQVTYPKDSDSTGFSCISGAVCSGTYSYSKANDKSYWFFANGMTISSGTIIIAYSPAIPMPTLSTGSTFDIGVNVPALFETTTVGKVVGVGTGGIPRGSYETFVSNVYTFSFTSSFDNVSNLFNVAVNKPNSITSKMNLSNNSGTQYTYETQFNTNNFSYSNLMCDGLHLDASTQTLSGTIALFSVGGSCTSTSPTPTPTPTINPSTGKGIIFDSSSYTIGQTANISWVISDSIWNVFTTNTISIRKIDDTDPNHFTSLLGTAPQTGTIQYTFYNCDGGFVCGTGGYEVVIYRNLLGIFETSRETASANVFEATAYVNSPLVVNEGQTVSVGWKFGVATNQGFLIDDKLSEFGLSTGTPIYNNLNCPCTVAANSTSITFVGVGKHRLTLMDASVIKNVASIIITVLPSDTVIGNNITTNYFTIDASSYNFGNTIYGQYQISTFNWSIYPVVLAELTSAANIPMGNAKLVDQTGSFELPITASQLNFIQGGSAFVNLSFKSNVFNSTTITAASIPVTINLNKGGWSIFVNKKEICNNDIFDVKYTSPTGTGIIQLSYFTNSNVNKQVNYSFNTNGTKKLSISDAHLNAGVAIDIQDTNGIYQIGTLIKVVDKGCQGAGPTATATPGKTTEQAQTDIGNLLSADIFWALIITSGLMTVVAIETSKNKSDPMIPSTVTGFLSIAGFTLIGWIPKWITFMLVMIVLVIFAWQRARSVNTAGE